MSGSRNDVDGHRETGTLNEDVRRRADEWWRADYERLHGAGVVAAAEGSDRFRRSFAFTHEVEDQVVAIATGVCSLGLGYLHELIVDEAHRGKGIGSALLQSVERFCRERGARRLALRTDAISDAVSFYEHYGWRAELENHDWFGGHVYLQMRKDLA